MSILSSRDHRFDPVLTTLAAICVLLALAIPFAVHANASSERDSQQTRENTIESLVERYDVETIEVHYEALDEDALVDIDIDGDLDDAVLRLKVRAVVTIDGMRRPDCRIADESTDTPRLDCADGEPAERDAAEQGSGA